jgi:hypothetical protein
MRREENFCFLSQNGNHPWEQNSQNSCFLLVKMAPPKLRTKTLVFYVKVANHPMRTKLLFFYLSKWQPPMRTKLLVSKSKWRPPMRTKLVKKQDLCEEHSPYILYTLLVYGSPCPSSILGHCKLTQQRMTHDDDDDDIGILQPLCDLVLISYQLIDTKC